MSRIPLHYQILAALIIGTVVGLVINPGDVELSDSTATVQATPAGLAYSEAAGLVERTFPDEEALSRRFPAAAAAWIDAGRPLELEVPVTRRRLHITEDSRRITIDYSRRQSGQPVVTTVTAGDAVDLASKHPGFAPLYQEYGGGWARHVTAVAHYIGGVFLNLLKMVTIPLIVTSLVTGISGLGTTARLGKLFSKTLLYYVTTSMLAISGGILMVNLIRPGVGAVLPGGGETAVTAGEQSLPGIFMGLLESMIPENPIESLAGAEFLSIITFSILLGIFIIHVGGRSGEILREFFQAAFDVMMSMTMFIIRLAPIGVLAFIIFATASQGADIFRTLAKYMLTVFLALSFHALVVLPLIVKFVAKRSPWQFAKATSPALMTAFSTASSNATLPLTIASVENRAGISNRVSSFVLPLGATINMDGTALYEAVAVLFIAQATPGFAMTLQAQILVAITALLASVGAAGIPHAGLVMMAIVLQAVGLPLEAQGVIIAVDRVLDMARTAVNVWSDSCGCAVVARFDGGDEVELPPSPSALPE